MSEDPEEVYENKEVYQDAFYFVAPLGFEGTWRVWGTTAYDQVTEEKTESAYVLKMDIAVAAPGGGSDGDWVGPGPVGGRPGGRGGQGKVAEERQGEGESRYKDLGLVRFKTVHVSISS